VPNVVQAVHLLHPMQSLLPKTTVHAAPVLGLAPPPQAVVPQPPGGLTAAHRASSPLDRGGVQRTLAKVVGWLSDHRQRLPYP